MSRFRWCACLLAAPLYAAAINVSTQTSVTLNTGDTLVYSISAYSYLVHAPQLGGPAYPADFTFSLLTDPLIAGLDLGVTLESYNGDFAAAIPDAAPMRGYMSGSLYQGPVGGETGTIALSPALSSGLFSGPAVLLEVQNLGGAVTLGLPPYNLLQSLQVSLSGISFSVGGVVAAANLEKAQAAPPAAFENPLDAGPDVPEPASGALLALGGAALLLAAGARKRGSPSAQ